MNMSTRLITESTAGETVTLTLSRPDKRNALSTALREELCDLLDKLASDETVKVVLLTGAGSTFSAGFDLDELAIDDEETQRKLWASADRFHDTLVRFSLPLIAVVNGPALAGGFDLAVFCDVRLASTEARFAHPEHRFSDVVYAPLHDIVGGGIARDLCLTGRSVDADEALRLGLVSAVVAPDALMGEAQRYAEMMAQAPRKNLVRTKAKALRRSGIDASAL